MGTDPKKTNGSKSESSELMTEWSAADAQEKEAATLLEAAIENRKAVETKIAILGLAKQEKEGKLIQITLPNGKKMTPVAKTKNSVTPALRAVRVPKVREDVTTLD